MRSARRLKWPRSSTTWCSRGASPAHSLAEPGANRAWPCRSVIRQHVVRLQGSDASDELKNVLLSSYASTSCADEVLASQGGRAEERAQAAPVRFASLTFSVNPIKADAAPRRQVCSSRAASRPRTTRQRPSSRRSPGSTRRARLLAAWTRSLRADAGVSGRSVQPRRRILRALDHVDVDRLLRRDGRPD